MARRQRAPKSMSQGYGTIDRVADQHTIRRSGEGRRFLKQMDRRLLRFSSQVGFLEECASRLSDDENLDLTLAVESLHREILLLRAEIRDHLAGGQRSLAEMAEYVEESWNELRDTFDELREHLAVEDPSARPAASRIRTEEEPKDQEWSLDEDDWADEEDDRGIPDVHPPKAGPKR